MSRDIMTQPVTMNLPSDASSDDSTAVYEAERPKFDAWKKEHGIRGSFEEFCEHLLESYASSHHDIFGWYDWPRIFETVKPRIIEYMTYTDVLRKLAPPPPWEPKKKNKLFS